MYSFYFYICQRWRKQPPATSGCSMLRRRRRHHARHECSWGQCWRRSREEESVPGIFRKSLQTRPTCQPEGEEQEEEGEERGPEGAEGHQDVGHCFRSVLKSPSGLQCCNRGLVFFISIFFGGVPHSATHIFFKLN